MPSRGVFVAVIMLGTVLLLMVGLGVICVVDGEEPALIHVHVLFRHGARTPLQLYPTDPNKASWLDGLGQLTDTGRLQQQALGEFLRQRFVSHFKLLNPIFDPNQVEVRSTNKTRTLESALINIHTIFAPPNSPTISWPKVQAEDYKHDFLLNARSQCPRRLRLWQLFHDSPEYNLLGTTHETLLHQLSTMSGMPIDLDNYWVISENKQVPEWIMHNMDELTLVDHTVLNFTNGFGLTTRDGVNYRVEIPKVVAGPIWEDISQRIDLKWDCLTSQQRHCDGIAKLKYNVYSGHDMIISALFAILGIDHMDLDRDGYPGVAACVWFELWRIKDKPYVKVYYRRNDGMVHNVLEKAGLNDLTWSELKDKTEPYKLNMSPRDFCQSSVKTTPRVLRV